MSLGVGEAHGCPRTRVPVPLLRKRLGLGDLAAREPVSESGELPAGLAHRDLESQCAHKVPCEVAMFGKARW